MSSNTPTAGDTAIFCDVYNTLTKDSQEIVDRRRLMSSYKAPHEAVYKREIECKGKVKRKNV
jgi:hypothetical protein